MNKKRNSIAIIIPGGIGTGKDNLGVPVLERLVKMLSKDFQITVFSLFRVNKDYEPQEFELIDVSHGISLIRFAKLLLTVRRHHKRKNFTVIHGFWGIPSGMFAVLLARTLNVKSIVSILGGDAISLPEIRYGQLQRPLSRMLMLWTLQRADVVIVLTRYLLENLRKAGMKREIVEVIPWGVDTDLFAFREKQVNTPVQFLHIGNLHPVKDQETMLRAFKIISEQFPAQLTIIGEGVIENKIRSLVTSLELNNVSFVKPLAYEQLPEHYKRADMLLHTSLSEGQSEVVTEAMSSGVVVCGTKVGLMYDEPSCCIAVDVKDYHLLAKLVVNVLRDPEAFATVRENARRWASSRSIHWTVGQLSKLYRDQP